MIPTISYVNCNCYPCRLAINEAVAGSDMVDVWQDESISREEFDFQGSLNSFEELQNPQQQLLEYTLTQKFTTSYQEWQPPHTPESASEDLELREGLPLAGTTQTVPWEDVQMSEDELGDSSSSEGAATPVLQESPMEDVSLEEGLQLVGEHREYPLEFPAEIRFSSSPNRLDELRDHYNFHAQNVDSSRFMNDIEELELMHENHIMETSLRKQASFGQFDFEQKSV